MAVNVIKKLLLDEILGSESELSSFSDSTDSSDTESLVNVIVSALNSDTCSAQILSSYSDKNFLKHFHISRPLFDHLAKMFSQSNANSSSSSTQMQLAIFLWFAAHENCTYRNVSRHFRLSLGIVSKAMDAAMHFLSSLSPNVIKWPTEEEKMQTTDFMKNNTGIRGVVGILGCTRIRIEDVAAFTDTTTNICSICLQGICNEKMRFMDISVGFPGYTHDNRVFQKSEIYNRLPTLCRSAFILADEAYARRQNLITPYRDDGELSPMQITFNQRLYSARMRIDLAFEQLKRRFPQLKHCKLKDMEQIGHFVRACAVLHNLCCEAYQSDCKHSPE